MADGVVVMHSDISKRKLADEVLAESDERFRFLSEWPRRHACWPTPRRSWPRYAGCWVNTWVLHAAHTQTYMRTATASAPFMDCNMGCASTVGDRLLSRFGAQAVAELKSGRPLVLRKIGLRPGARRWRRDVQVARHRGDRLLPAVQARQPARIGRGSTDPAARLDRRRRPSAHGPPSNSAAPSNGCAKANRCCGLRAARLTLAAGQWNCRVRESLGPTASARFSRFRRPPCLRSKMPLPCTRRGRSTPSKWRSRLAYRPVRPSMSSSRCGPRPDAPSGCAVTGEAQRNGAGSTTRVHGALQDVTAQKRAESERARLAAILESTTDLVGICGSDGHLLYLNCAGHKALEVDPSENLADALAWDFVSRPESESTVAEGIRTAVRQGTWSGETVLLTRRGREIPVSQVLIAHKGSDGQVALAVGGHARHQRAQAGRTRDRPQPPGAAAPAHRVAHPLRSRARDDLVQGCGRCHRAAQPPRGPKPLARRWMQSKAGRPTRSTPTRRTCVPATSTSSARASPSWVS